MEKLAGKAARFGGKLRALRRREGLTQAAMAERLGLSPSYLNLIENDRRPLPAGILIKLAQLFSVDLQAFGSDGDQRLTGDLLEAFSDPLFDEQGLTSQDVRELVSATPAAARAVLTLYRAFRATRSTTDSLVAQIAHGEDVDGVTRSHLPSEEVSDFIQEAKNYFGEVEDAAAAFLASKAAAPDEDVYSALLSRARNAFGLRVEIVRFGGERPLIRKYDPSTLRLQLSELLPTRGRSFQLAHQIGLLACDALFERLTKHPTLGSDESRTLARVALANYFAGAVLMPYEAFLASAKAERYDVDTLGRKFRVSFEQICHRLTTLRRPGAEGVPFHMLRLDVAGNISKRFSASGIHFARYAGACPKWNLFSAFQTPGMIRVQISRMPDGATYFCIARTVQKDAVGYHAQKPVMTIGLGCRMEHAAEMVYSEGMDLGNPALAVPVGVTCRLCERTDCDQRAFPSMKAKLALDENVRGTSLYAATRG